MRVIAGRRRPAAGRLLAADGDENLVIAALLLGVGTVTLAPLLTVRRLVRLDLPATLRVVE